jgi:hypothetical protein
MMMMIMTMVSHLEVVANVHMQLHVHPAHVPHRTRYGIHYPIHIVAEHAAAYERQEHVAAAIDMTCRCEQRRLVICLKHQARKLLPQLVAHAAVAATARAAVHLLHVTRLLTNLPTAAKVHPHIRVHPYSHQGSKTV